MPAVGVEPKRGGNVPPIAARPKVALYNCTGCRPRLGPAPLRLRAALRSLPLGLRPASRDADGVELQSPAGPDAKRPDGGRDVLEGASCVAFGEQPPVLPVGE